MLLKSMRLLTMLCLLAMLFTACSPSSKNEGQYWTNHQQAAAEHKTKYPAFAPLIDAQMQAATAAHAEAAKVTDEAKQAEQMKAANAIAGELNDRLNEIKYKSESVETTIKKLNELKLPKSDQQRRADAVTSAYNGLTEVQTALNEAKPATKEEALEALKPQISRLIEINGDAERALKALKPAKPAKKKK